MQSAKESAINIIQRLRDHGHTAFICGGAARDHVLGIEPHDVDVCTSARPAEVMSLFPESAEIGAKFAVVLVKVDGQSIEVATYRSDGIYEDGRRPIAVTLETDPAKDVQRRDFTINGLLQNPFTDEIIDHVGGLEDLRNGVIRAIGNPADRFREDHLRMLRAVRFAARFGFVIELRTLTAIQEQAPAIQMISCERVRDELSRILTEGGAERGLELLYASGLLKQIMPEMLPLIGCTQPAEFHPEGTVWNHVLKILGEMGKPQSLEVALACLLHDIGKPATRTVDPDGRIRFNGHADAGAAMTIDMLTRLRYPTETISLVASIVADHMDFMTVENMRPSTFKRFVSKPRFEEYLSVHRLDCLGGMGAEKLTHYNYIREKLAEIPPEVIRPTPLITGRDLIAAGYKPGPGFSVALRSAETAQLDELITTKEQALEIAIRVLGPHMNINDQLPEQSAAHE